MHPHIHMIGHYNPLVRIIDIASLIREASNHLFCVCWFNTWVAGDLQFKVDREREVFEKFFMVILYMPEENRQRNIFLYFMTLGLNRKLTSSKSAHYILNYLRIYLHLIPIRHGTEKLMTYTCSSRTKQNQLIRKVTKLKSPV